MDSGANATPYAHPACARIPSTDCISPPRPPAPLATSRASACLLLAEARLDVLQEHVERGRVLSVVRHRGAGAGDDLARLALLVNLAQADPLAEVLRRLRRATRALHNAPTRDRPTQWPPPPPPPPRPQSPPAPTVAPPSRSACASAHYHARASTRAPPRIPRRKAMRWQAPARGALPHRRHDERDAAHVAQRLDQPRVRGLVAVGREAAQPRRLLVQRLRHPARTNASVVVSQPRRPQPPPPRTPTHARNPSHRH